jgi:hypothetical protein
MSEPSEKDIMNRAYGWKEFQVVPRLNFRRIVATCLQFIRCTSDAC